MRSVPGLLYVSNPLFFIQCSFFALHETVFLPSPVASWLLGLCCSQSTPPPISPCRPHYPAERCLLSRKHSSVCPGGTVRMLALPS